MVHGVESGAEVGDDAPPKGTRMNKAELAQVVGRALLDPSFASELGSDPVGAAHSLGVQLSPSDLEALKQLSPTRVSALSALLTSSNGGLGPSALVVADSQSPETEVGDRLADIEDRLEAFGQRQAGKQHHDSDDALTERLDRIDDRLAFLEEQARGDKLTQMFATIDERLSRLERGR
jgi:hypothetical protein